jgi:hypothetical protein
MAKPWGGVGAWALDAERAEEEEREQAAAGGGKKKKNKGTTLSLSEFTTYGAPQRRVAPLEPKGLTPQEMVMLPTGPRERSAEELDRSRHGGFRSYGGPMGGDRPERRGGFDDDDRRGSRDLDLPSRADEADNWAMNKKSTPAASDSGRPDRFGGPSPAGRADDIDNWSRDKKPLPSRYPSLGSGGGFRDSPGFRDSLGSSDSDRWARAGGFTPMPQNGEGERRRLVLEPLKRDPTATPAPPVEVARNRPSPFGAARPREAVLAEKGVDWRKIDSEIDQKKTSRPTSSHSSRPDSAHSSRPGSPGSQVSAAGSEGAPRTRSKVNPFGDAKPREVVLQAKGKDWRKIDLDLEHRAVNRPESDKEKILKEEISLLKVDLKEIEDKISGGFDQSSL